MHLTHAAPGSLTNSVLLDRPYWPCTRAGQGSFSLDYSLPYIYIESCIRALAGKPSTLSTWGTIYTMLMHVNSPTENASRPPSIALPLLCTQRVECFARHISTLLTQTRTHAKRLALRLGRTRPLPGAEADMCQSARTSNPATGSWAQISMLGQPWI